MNFYEDNVKEQLFVEMYNVKKLEDFPKDVLYECRGELALVYRLGRDNELGGKTGELVTDGMMVRWGVGAETISRDAWINTMAKYPPILRELTEVCEELPVGEQTEDSEPAWGGKLGRLDVFVLTNMENHQGALYIFDDETMQETVKKLGGSLIILPSSVNETIVYSEDYGMGLRRMKDAVQEINHKYVKAEEILSGEIYRYDKETHTLQTVQVPEHEETNMPDVVSMKEMHDYGYEWNGMLPLTRERALELWDDDQPLFKLYGDGTEIMLDKRDEILSHEGIFGVERETWNRYLKTMQPQEMRGMAMEM